METSASLGQTISYSEGDISLSEVISALTFALDFTDGAVPGHSLRTCLLGMRIAEALHVSAADLGHLYYALLLKDIGCSDNAARFSQIMAADDRPMPPSTSWLGDIAADPALLERIWREVLPGVPLPARVGRYRIAITEDHDPMLAWELESSRVTQTLENLGMSDVTVKTIHLIDERWDGSGLPSGLCHQQIPLLARICSIAQTLDAFAKEHGSETALRMVRSRRGTWFDPEIVRAAQHLHTSGKLWQVCQATDVEATRAEVMRLDPGLSSALTPERVDRICEAFGNTVDVKSPFTYRHFIGVTDVPSVSPLNLDWPRTASPWCAAPRFFTTSANLPSPTASSTSAAASLPRNGSTSRVTPPSPAPSCAASAPSASSPPWPPSTMNAWTVPATPFNSARSSFHSNPASSPWLTVTLRWRKIALTAPGWSPRKS